MKVTFLKFRVVSIQACSNPRYFFHAAHTTTPAHRGVRVSNKASSQVGQVQRVCAWRSRAGALDQAEWLQARVGLSLCR